MLASNTSGLLLPGCRRESSSTKLMCSTARRTRRRRSGDYSRVATRASSSGASPSSSRHQNGAGADDILGLKPLPGHSLQLRVLCKKDRLSVRVGSPSVFRMCGKDGLRARRSKLSTQSHKLLNMNADPATLHRHRPRVRRHYCQRSARANAQASPPRRALSSALVRSTPALLQRADGRNCSRWRSIVSSAKSQNRHLIICNPWPSKAVSRS